MWYGHPGFCFFPFGFLLLFIVGGMIFRFRWARNYGGCRREWQDDAETIIRRRLANGEIDEAEYQKLRETLKK